MSTDRWGQPIDSLEKLGFNVTNCSFCGKSEKEVARIIVGPAVYICDECVGLCVEILNEEKKAKAAVADVP